MARPCSRALRGAGPAEQDRPPPGRIHLFLALVSAVLVVAGAARNAGALEVRAWVDKTEATLEDQIFLTVSISGQRRLGSEPTLPPLPDFSAAKGGTSSRTEIVSGSIRTSVEVAYLLTPRRVGTFTIGPISIEEKGRAYQSQPLSVRILPAASGTEGRPMAFVTQHVDVPRPYIHQQIVYTFRFFRRIDSVEAQWDPPGFERFWVEDLGKERQYEKVLGGHRYAVTEIKKALYPLSEGPGKIGESLLVCRLVIRQGGRPTGMDSFFGGSFFGTRAQTVTKTLRAEPIVLDIQALPEPGRPEGFEGLVGSFTVQAEVGQNQLRTGDSTTLTVTVTGTGNLRDLSTVSPEDIPGFQVYPDRPSLRLKIEGDTLRGTKVFKKALVPLEGGLFEIPPQEVAFFDPEEGSYRVARTAPLVLTVEKDREREPLHLVSAVPLPGSKSSIKILGEDILPIHTGPAGARRQLPSGASLYAYLAGLLLPPCIFAVCYGKKRRQERLEIDQPIMRRKQSRKKADSLLKKARRQIRQPEDEAFLRHLSRSLRGLIGDKLNLNTLACTPVEIHRCLLERGLPEEEARGTREFLEQLEYEQYISKRLEAGQREALYRKAKELLGQMDRRI